MTWGEVALAVLQPVATVALAVITLRSHYRASVGARSRMAAHSVALVIALCTAFIVFAGARWWLIPSLPRMSIGAMVAAVVIASLWVGSSRRISTGAP